MSDCDEGGHLNCIVNGRQTVEDLCVEKRPVEILRSGMLEKTSEGFHLDQKNKQNHFFGHPFLPAQ